MPDGLRKTFNYKLKPTSEQERQLEDVVCRCRRLYSTALEQRIALRRQRGVSHTRYEQEAESADHKQLHFHGDQEWIPASQKASWKRGIVRFLFPKDSYLRAVR